LQEEIMFTIRSSARWIERFRFGWCLGVLLIMASSPVGATVLTGPIVDLPESVGLFYWGDGTHDLYQQWSVANVKFSGWFYGSTYSGTSNADVYTYPGLTDPTMVTNAESFTYNSVVVQASEGDCVFFRGTNGFYGAWRIDAIDPLPGGFPYAELNGQWYFQDDGTGNFSQATPVQGSTWGAIKARLGQR